jgi:hypothetical protein
MDKVRGETCRLVLKTLNNCESSWVVDVLHNKPINCLFILPIDSCGLDQFGLDTFNGVGFVVGVL